jgi:hypothetical protein
MAIVKRTSGDYIITTIDSAANVEIQTNTLTVTGNLVTTGFVDFPGADIDVNSVTTTDIVANGNITAGGAVTAAGNITGAVFIGDGSGLTGVPAGNALGNIISFGTSQVSVPQISGNVFVNVAGVSNVAVFSSTGANIAGNLRTGNILSGGFFFANGQPLTGSVKYDAFPVAPAGPNPGDFWFNTTNGILYQYNNDGDTNQWVDSSGIGTPPSTTSVLPNTVIQRDPNGSATANQWQGTSVLVTGNVTTSGGFFIGDGSQLTGLTDGNSIQAGTSSVTVESINGPVLITVSAAPIIEFNSEGILNRLANGFGNIGNTSSYFNTVFARATSALYADLAEIYDSDQDYPPGTVLVFGGDREVTQSLESHDPRAAGVVSTEPAYLMNTAESGSAVALLGKVPCRVIGPISKGDLLVTSDIPGVAQRMQRWVPGAVLGKSLEDVSDSTESIINIVIGRH